MYSRALEMGNGNGNTDNQSDYGILIGTWIDDVNPTSDEWITSVSAPDTDTGSDLSQEASGVLAMSSKAVKSSRERNCTSCL